MDKSIDLEKVEAVFTPKGNLYETFVDCRYKDVEIPKGTLTDGITAKKIKIIYLFINKYDPRVMTAVLVHDVLCERGEYEKADRYFKERLPEIWQKTYMVKAVKRYHDIKGFENV